MISPVLLQSRRPVRGQSDRGGAANAVQTAVAAAVLAEDHESGVPYTTRAQWTWENLGGLSIYAPFRVDDWKRAYYTGATCALRRTASGARCSTLLECDAAPASLHRRLRAAAAD